MNGITMAQWEILDHTKHRAANQNYCGDSSDMQVLVKLSLMRSVGKVGFCEDEYFTITKAGREQLAEGIGAVKLRRR